MQLWLIRHPNCLTNPILTLFYVVDLLLYSTGGPSGPKEFLSKRSRILGKNFAALGKIIVGEYAQVTQIIQSPQLRGYYLGRARINPSKVPDNFMLGLSDEDANPSAKYGALHSTLHEHMWMSVIPPAMERIDNDPAFAAYISEGVKAAKNAPKDTIFQEEIQRMTIRYICHAIFGSPLSGHDGTEDAIFTLFLGVNPMSSYVTGATDPFSKLLCCCQCPRNSNIAKVKKYILASPLMESYTPSGSNGNESADGYAGWILSLAGIAGIIGSSTLSLQVVRGIPSDLQIDLGDRKMLMLAVLEAARKQSPVNNINVILPSPRSMVVNGKQRTLRAGTVVAGSIGLASLDRDEFKEPNSFNMERENLLSSTVNFNSVGFDPNGSGRRTCPGRNIAMKLACDILVEYRSTQEGYVPATL
eukprot:CAMPEP_0197237356 /NCGR_PEP_ID=MMETSP1429-20130617/4202_1 /TAXON_ID=49237 /ORGANISM="Chaetoceros  sp., Strain UNC1202" /LENGTH=415 /DNA_ID=CAMNT_0042696339 /DNA_START=112 /DNA_END=1362 /DNA_ORIENTATION=-